MSTTVIHYGREFNVEDFSTVDECNAFLEENKDYGVLMEKDGTIYAARNDDGGKAVEWMI